MGGGGVAINWTPEESKELYLRAREWWLNDRIVLADIETRRIAFPDPVLATAERLGDFFARAILPRMEWAGENDWEVLRTWFQELRSAGVYPSVALPCVLLHRPSDALSVAETIRSDWKSDSIHCIAAAAEATRFWANLSASKKAPPVPVELIEALVDSVAFRKKVAIIPCLSELARLCFEQPEMITPAQVDLLLSMICASKRRYAKPQRLSGFIEFGRAASTSKLRVVAGWRQNAVPAQGAWYKASQGRSETSKPKEIVVDRTA